MNRVGLVVAATGLALAPAAIAQWSSNPATNLPVADRTGEQVQPKFAVAADGSAYLSWFDNSTGGYDVYLKRLDVRGYEQWGHNGILIADRGVSSTTDYDLEVDASGNAIIVFNDDTVVPGTDQIVVQKVTPRGVKLFPGSGFVVTSGTSSKSNPKVALLGSDRLAVGWSGQNAISVQSVLVSGALPALDGAATVISNGGLYVTLCDLVSAGDSTSWIAMWVSGTTTSPITSAKTLRAAKYSVGTGYAWPSGASGVPLGVSTSLQIANFPSAQSDNAGGLTAAWYEVGGARNAFFQRVRSDGVVQFATPLSIALPPNRIRIGASGSYDLTNDTYYLATVDSDASPQGNYGVTAQRFNSVGTPLWGAGYDASGVVAGGQPGFVSVLPRGDGGAYLFFLNNFLSGSGQIWGGSIAPDAVSSALVLMSSAPGSKGRLATAGPRANGFAITAFQSGDDILAQNLSVGASLGGLCYANCDLSSTAPTLNAGDFACFLSEFRANNPYANCDGSTTPPTLNAGDFTCFLTRFRAGCP